MGDKALGIDICTRCDGTGWSGDSPAPDEQPCELCDGKGYIERAWPRATAQDVKGLQAPTPAQEAAARAAVVALAEQPPEHIMQFFAYEHLPEHLRYTSSWFARVAADIAYLVPRNPERTVALRKLLEAKDAAVRAMVAQ